MHLPMSMRRTICVRVRLSALGLRYAVDVWDSAVLYDEGKQNILGAPRAVFQKLPARETKKQKEENLKRFSAIWPP